MIVLGFVGQLAWTVENMYLNVFLYDTVSDDPTAIATMVAASVVTATVATLLIGSLSDRTGRRRVFIAAGYVLWGLSTAAFGLVTVDAVANLAPAARYDTPDRLGAAFARLHAEQIVPAIPRGLSATVYTQLSDVEDELNGLLTYDREVLKLPEDLVRAVNLRLTLDRTP